MPLDLQQGAPTVFIRRAPWERSGLARADVDHALNLTAEEFRVEGQLVAVGPLVGETQVEQLVTLLEGAGLVYFEEFFEFSGNWPEWLAVFVAGG
jgi:hypothetical protein